MKKLFAILPLVAFLFACGNPRPAETIEAMPETYEVDVIEVEDVVTSATPPTQPAAAPAPRPAAPATPPPAPAPTPDPTPEPEPEPEPTVEERVQDRVQERRETGGRR